MIQIRMDRLARITIFIAAPIALLAASPANACTCLESPPPLAALAEATVVFSGVVVNISPAGVDLDVSLQVTGWWKGVTSSPIVIRTASHPVSCGFDFEVGVEYLVYAYPGTPAQGGALSTTGCTRTTPIAEAGADLAELGPPMPPP